MTIKILNCPSNFSNKVAVKVKITREYCSKHIFHGHFWRAKKIISREKKKPLDTVTKIILNVNCRKMSIILAHLSHTKYVDKTKDWLESIGSWELSKITILLLVKMKIRRGNFKFSRLLKKLGKERISYLVNQVSYTLYMLTNPSL